MTAEQSAVSLPAAGPAVDADCLCGHPHPCPAHGPHIGRARHPWPPPPPRRPDPFNGRLLLQVLAEHDHRGDNTRHTDTPTRTAPPGGPTFTPAEAG